MGRWGLEGMKSFEQAELAREEGTRELEHAIPVDWSTPHYRFDFTYLWYRSWKPHVSISVSSDSRNQNTLNVANQNPSIQPCAPPAFEYFFQNLFPGKKRSFSFPCHICRIR